MCGIAGYFGAQLPELIRIQATSRSLAHRGPDGEGIYTHQANGKSVCLLHRRLAILDLDRRSDQPFRYQESVLVFNGEIYNYLEVRQELKALGHQFETQGDTEVLAHALWEWGTLALDKLEGMWAFAWYHEGKGELLLCRDRFAEKPLYLWPQEHGVYFASEVKGLAALAGSWPQPNQNHLLRYLINGYKALYKVQETFFQEVQELPHASFLRLSPQTSQILPESYWSIFPDEQPTMSYQEAVEQTRSSLIQAVRLRMRADVPLAFCMSGGIDSNSLISIARRVLGCDVHGFTIVNTDARYEEQELVDLAVKELAVRQTSVPVSPKNFLQNLQKLVAAHDAPVYTISYYVHWQLMQAIADQGYKVTISGTAADELFTGYYDHHNLYLQAIAHEPRWHQQAKTAWLEHLAPIVRNPYLQDPDLYLKDPACRAHIFLNNDVFAQWLYQPWMEEFTETAYVPSLLRNRMLNELFAEAVPVILHEDDLNAMFFSMENRSPFLDRQVFELAYSIPSQHLIQDGRAKSVLREAMRGIVPDAVLDNRRKVGFNAPIMDLLDANDSAVRAYLLDDSPVYQLVRKENIEAVLKQKEIPNSVSKFLFNFINIKMFLEAFA